MNTNKQTTEEWRQSKRDEMNAMFEKNRLPLCKYCGYQYSGDVCTKCNNIVPGFNSWMAHKN